MRGKKKGKLILSGGSRLRVGLECKLRKLHTGGYSIIAGFCKIRCISKGGGDGISV